MVKEERIGVEERRGEDEERRGEEKWIRLIFYLTDSVGSSHTMTLNEKRNKFLADSLCD